MSSYDFLQRICKKRCETWEKAEELEAHFQDELEEMFDVPSFWSDITSEAKRSILTELFESVTLKDNSVSVKYTFFAESVAKRSRKTKEIMEGQNMLNRTDKNYENNRGAINKKDLKNEIYPVWQPLMDELRTIEPRKPKYNL